MMLELLGPRNVGMILDILAGLLALSIFWAMFKASYQRVTGEPVPRNKLTVALDVLADLSNNIPGAANRLQRLSTGESMFWKDQGDGKK